MGWQWRVLLMTILLAGCVDNPAPLGSQSEMPLCSDGAPCRDKQEQAAATRRLNLLRNTFVEFDRFQLR